MYLYDRKTNGYMVYSLEAKDEQIYSYKQNQMKKIDYYKQILSADNYTLAYGEVPLFELYQDQFDSIIIPQKEVYMSEGFTNRNLSVTNVDHGTHQELLHDYYSGRFFSANVARIREFDQIRYLLLTKDKYYRDIHDNRHMKLSNIIEIPKSLFLLQMLQQEKFSFLDQESIFELIQLFSLSKINEISFMELRKMDMCGVTHSSCDTVFQKSENDSKILKYVNQLH